MAIRSFADKVAEEFFVSGRIGKKVGWASVKKVVMRKLDMLHYAARLNDLESPPGNRLEELKGKMKGIYSIRVNDQWRIVFKWSPAGPEDVKVTDYH
ncbi:MAG: plasmid maintenance system killer protein [Deltaproteobacteria bacterium]|nr:MAG: plasmid maintenance system killer protein [Deltaproteobacteria bacterium]